MLSTFFKPIFISLLFISSGYASSKCADTHQSLTLHQVIYEATDGNNQATVGSRRLVTNQSGVARSELSRDYVQATPMGLDNAELVLRGTSGSGKAHFNICTTDKSGQDTFISSKTLHKNETLHIPLNHLVNKRLSLHVYGNGLLTDLAYDIKLNVPPQNEPLKPNKTRPKATATGFADIHVHQMGDLAFGGGWYFGSHKSGHPELNLANDLGRHGANIAGINIYGSHSDLKEGYPSFKDWPSAYDISHQQVAGDWLKKAHEHGLNFMVASVVNNQWLCAAVVASGYHHKNYTCHDMEEAKRQINAIHEFAKNNDWYVVVRDPWEARRAIANGKLAVMIAVEVSNLFPKSDGDFIRQLHELYALDVRSVQLAHEVNSLYSGAALHNDVFKFLGEIKAMFNFGVDYATDKTGTHNQIGLTKDGERLIDEMVKLHMPIDIAHLSLKSQKQVLERIKTQHHQFPVFNSHTRIRELLPEGELKKLKEHNTPLDILKGIKATGGVIGLRTGDNPMLSYLPQHDKQVANNCDGSVRSLIQFYQYAVDKGVNTAFASDFNGFITQIVPRFGPHACSSAGDNRASQAQNQGEQPANIPDYAKDYLTKGLAHIGLLPAVLWDMKQLGSNTDNLSHSAENFLVMWEKAYR